MKLMKKFGILVALALIVTVGGVYATWTYATGDNVNAAEKEIMVNLAEYALAGGGLQVVDASGISLLVDDTDNNHKAELVINGPMIIIFTPAQNVTEQNIRELDFTITITQKEKTQGVNLAKYNEKDIFTIKNGGKITGKAVEAITADTIVDGHPLSAYAGQWYLKLTADEVREIIILTEEFELHNLEAWHTFNGAIGTIAFSASVTAE